MLLNWFDSPVIQRPNSSLTVDYMRNYTFCAVNYMYNFILYYRALSNFLNHKLIIRSSNALLKTKCISNYWHNIVQVKTEMQIPVQPRWGIVSTIPILFDRFLKRIPKVEASISNVLLSSSPIPPPPIKHSAYKNLLFLKLWLNSRLKKDEYAWSSPIAVVRWLCW